MNTQQLRAQIAALQDATMDENRNFRSAYDEGKFDALTAVDALLNSLQEEPISEDLEYASEKYACRFSSSKYGHDKVKDAFIAGDKWKEEQIMAKAKGGTVQEDYQIIMDDGTYIDLDPSMSLKPALAVKAGERIKVIVIKEEDV